ncbi:nSTAND1 domain-containing NTPase [Brunnivagina elsteri]|uniref:Uncharacterized protein n=1 Tax=Brunnivagina elsteri CCALA 953 TaxID=987040 RepID=A0A2A2TFS8_9CYAN|nr:WD40 repeat domain-containing protein [Calothrix elsteri]PAX52573.1 hypothetical protein CK510_18565 [Calothrix elsteri CCALA 953]
MGCSHHLFVEYPLQTPKRIVEGVGELILGKRNKEITADKNRIGLVIEGFPSSNTTVEISKILSSRGCFELEYLQASKITTIDIKTAIIRYLQSQHLRKETGLVFLYLRGVIEETDAGEWLILGDTRLKRSWLKQQLRCCDNKQVIILDIAGVNTQNKTFIQDWIEDLQIKTKEGQCVLAYISTYGENECFAQNLLDTLTANLAPDGLSAAGMIAQLQLSLADSSNTLQAYLSGTQGIIEILPGISEVKQESQAIDLGICPYMGLSAFSEEDTQYFYGREDLTQQLINQIQNKSFLAVIGASGSGKSSIVQAGFIPALRQGKQIPNSQQWLIKKMRPNANPLETLAQKLDGDSPLLMEGILNLGIESFVYWLRSRPKPILLLVIDQFEELFTLTSPPDRGKFLDLLLGVIEYASDRFKLIITLRADFIASCLEVIPLANLLQSHNVLVPPSLSLNDYRRIIINPAQQVGLRVEPELVEVLLHELNDSAGDLPLVEFVLEQLWHHRVNGELTLKAYQEKLGGIQGALERSSQNVYENLDAKEQECAKWIFLSLTQLGEGTEDTRRRVYKSELIVRKYSTQLIEKTLQAFTAAKLVVVNLEGEGKGEIGDRAADKGDNRYIKVETDTHLEVSLPLPPVTVEVAHEILIRHWSTLRWWLEENRARLRSQRQVEQAAQLWRYNQSSSDFLLQGIRLAEAEDIYIKYIDELSPDVQEFVVACLEERKRQQVLEKRRLKQAQRAVVALSILGVAAVSLGGLAYWKSQTAQLQEVEALNESSKANLLSNQQLEALVASVKAGKRLQNTIFVPDNIKFSTLNTLQKAFYNIQERNRIEGHSATVTSAKFSPDGKIIASTSDDNSVIIWSRNGKLLRKLQGHQDAIKSASFNPQGNLLATASFDKTIKLWNPHDGKLIRTLVGHEKEVMSVQFSPDGSILASGSNDNTVKIWKANDGTLIATLKGHNQTVNAVSFNADGKLIASASGDSTINIWQLNNNRLIKTLRRHGNQVNSIAFSPDNKILASASSDKMIKIWDFNKGSLITTFASHTSPVKSLAFSQDGKTLVSAGDDNIIKLWDIQQGNVIVNILGHSNGILNVNFSKDGKTIISAGADQTIRLWELKDLPQTIQANQGQIYSVNINPQANLIATSGNNTTIKLWQFPSLKLRQTLEGYNKSVYGHSQEVQSVAFSADGETLASASKDWYIKLWRTRDGYMIKTITGHQDQVNSVSFNPKGDILASGSKDKTIKLWRVKDFRLINTLTGHTGEVFGAVFSPQGDTIASASMDTTIKIWREKDGKLLQTIIGHKKPVNNISFNPQGDILASASSDNTIKLWKKNQTGRFATPAYKTLLGHRDAVLGVSFSPDGQIIASASRDRTIKLWDKEGRELKTFIGHDNSVMNLSFSRDGKILASSSFDGTAKVWYLDKTKLQTLDLNNLLAHSCAWLDDYLQNNPNINSQEQHLCPNFAAIGLGK